MNKQSIIDYINDNYDVKPDYLWDKFPDYAAFRHKSSEKWFGLLMNVSPNKLNLDDDHELDILNVKCEQELINGLTDKNYIFPGYHMSKEHWVSIVLEYVDSDSRNKVYELIEDSFDLTKQ